MWGAELWHASFKLFGGQGGGGKAAEEPVFVVGVEMWPFLKGAAEPCWVSRSSPGVLGIALGANPPQPPSSRTRAHRNEAQLGRLSSGWASSAL